MRGRILMPWSRTEGFVWGCIKRPSPRPRLTFVKPDLLKYLDAFEQKGIEFEFRHLGNDVFNEVGWLDPSGQLVRLVEARTFSPSKRLANDTSRCGYFSRSRCRRRIANWRRLTGKTSVSSAWTKSRRSPAAYRLHQRFHRSRLVSSRGFAACNVAIRSRRCGRHSGASCRQRHRAEWRIAAAGLRSVPAAVLLAPEGTPILLTSSSAHVILNFNCMASCTCKAPCIRLYGVRPECRCRSSIEPAAIDAMCIALQAEAEPTFARCVPPR